MSGTERNGENVRDSKFAYRGRGGAAPAVTYFFHWRLDCVCMHAYKKDLFARKKYETEFKS